MTSGVTAGVSAEGSVGVGGKGMGDSGTPLARLGCVGEGEAGVEGLLAGEGLVAGDGDVPAGQRLQVAAQYPPAGAVGLNIMAELQLPIVA